MDEFNFTSTVMLAEDTNEAESEDYLQYHGNSNTKRQTRHKKTSMLQNNKQSKQTTDIEQHQQLFAEYIEAFGVETNIEESSQEEKLSEALDSSTSILEHSEAVRTIHVYTKGVLSNTQGGWSAQVVSDVDDEFNNIRTSGLIVLDKLDPDYMSAISHTSVGAHLTAVGEALKWIQAHAHNPALVNCSFIIHCANQTVCTAVNNTRLKAQNMKMMMEVRNLMAAVKDTIQTSNFMTRELTLAYWRKHTRQDLHSTLTATAESSTDTTDEVMKHEYLGHIFVNGSLKSFAAIFSKERVADFHGPDVCAVLNSGDQIGFVYGGPAAVDTTKKWEEEQWTEAERELCMMMHGVAALLEYGLLLKIKKNPEWAAASSNNSFKIALTTKLRDVGNTMRDIMNNPDIDETYISTIFRAKENVSVALRIRQAFREAQDRLRREIPVHIIEESAGEEDNWTVHEVAKWDAMQVMSFELTEGKLILADDFEGFQETVVAEQSATTAGMKQQRRINKETRLKAVGKRGQRKSVADRPGNFHDGQRSMECPCDCGRSFQTQQQLTNHMKETHLFHPFPDHHQLTHCEDCGQIMKRTSVSSHRKNQHPLGGGGPVPIRTFDFNEFVEPDRERTEITRELGDELIARFNKPISHLHYLWTSPITILTTYVVNKLVQRNEEREAVILFIIPGVIQAYNAWGGQKKKNSSMKISTVKWLTAILAEDDPSEALLHEALRMNHEKKRKEKEEEAGREQGTTTSYKRRLPGHKKRNLPEVIAKLGAKLSVAAKEGKIGAATLGLQEMERRHREEDASMSVRLSDEETRELILTACKSRSAADEGPGMVSANRAVAQVTADECAAGFRRLRTTSAGGHDSWRYSLLKTLGAGCRDSPELCEAFASLINRFLRGQISNAVVGRFNEARMAIIPKRSGKPRVITLTSAMTRLIERVVNSKFKDRVGKAMAPYQYATGVPGGPEILPRMLQLDYDINKEDRTRAIISVDVTDAFASIHQSAVAAGLEEHMPELLNFFQLTHSEPTRVFDNSGKYLGATASGVLQGRPLSSLYFSVGTFNHLVKAKEDIEAECRQQGYTEPQSHLLPQAKEAEHLPDPPKIPLVGLAAFADDINITLPVAMAARAFKVLVLVLGQIGLTLSAPKTQLIANDDRESWKAADEIGCTQSSEGGVILGIPIGTREFCEGYARSTVEETLRLVDALSTFQHIISSQIRYVLLAASIIHQCTYLFRVLESSSPVLAALKVQVDKAVHAAVTNIIGESSEQDAQFIGYKCNLPCYMGGLGLPQFGGDIGEKGLIQSREQAWLFWTAPGLSNLPLRCYAVLAQARNHTIDWAVRDEAQHTEYLRQQGETNPPRKEDQDPCWIKSRWRALMRLILARAKDHVREGSSAIGMEQSLQNERLADLTSKEFRGSGRELMILGCISGHQLTEKQFRDVLRLQLNFPPANWVRSGKMCQCRNVDVDLGGYHQHALDCAITAKRRYTHRHDQIVRALQEMLSALPRSAGNVRGYQTTLAPRLNAPTEAQPERYILGDLSIETDEGLVIVDVGVTHHAARSAIRDLQSDHVPDAAAKRYERAKRRHYEAVPGLMESGRFVPFIIESSGRLGPAARLFLAKWTVGQSVIRNRFLNQMAVLLAQATGGMMAAFRRRFEEGWLADDDDRGPDEWVFEEEEEEGEDEMEE